MNFLLTDELVEKIQAELTRFGGMMALRDELLKVGFTLDVGICRRIVNAVMSGNAVPSETFENEQVVIL